MTELFHIVERPRECSYLPHETASLELRGIADMTVAEYADLLSRGYRRFGMQVFRPACRHCDQCRSIRILPQQWTPSASERRILRKNAHIRAELHPLFVTRQHLDLYNRYHAFMHGHRDWALQRTNAFSYQDEFLSGAAHAGRQWLYFDAGQLVGVAIMDEVPGAISLVYFFYDPAWRQHSPGIYSVLNQFRYAQQRGHRYAYLGYWVEACQSMRYKGRFRPSQILQAYPAPTEAPLWRESPSPSPCQSAAV